MLHYLVIQNPPPHKYFCQIFTTILQLLLLTLLVFIKCEQRKKTANKASKQGLPTNIVNDACQSPPPIIDPFLQILEK